MLLVWWVVSYQHRELQSTQGLVMVHARPLLVDQVVILVGCFFLQDIVTVSCHEFYSAARCSLLGPLAKCYPAEHLSCLGKALNASCILLHIFACCFCPCFYT